MLFGGESQVDRFGCDKHSEGTQSTRKADAQWTPGWSWTGFWAATTGNEIRKRIKIYIDSKEIREMQENPPLSRIDNDATHVRNPSFIKLRVTSMTLPSACLSFSLEFFFSSFFFFLYMALFDAKVALIGVLT